MPVVLWEFFEGLNDPRRDQGKRHSAEAIVTVTLVGILCGAESTDEVVDIAEAKLDWLETFLELPHGIASADTIERFFRSIDPEHFAAMLADWSAHLAKTLKSDLIVIDGKTLRRSHDRFEGIRPLHLVSAWCHDNSLVLGQIATEEKSNEITAIPKLLDLLLLEGSVVSIDAMGTQREIARKILEKDGHYLLALKANQETLHADVSQFFRQAFSENAFDREIRPLPHTQATDLHKGHGRLERRSAYCVDQIQWLLAHDWPGLRSVICVRSERTVGDETSEECRYFLSSLAISNPGRLLRLVRSHWSIENSLHWCLDVTFGEDAGRIRNGSALECIAAIRRASVSLLKSEQTFKASIRRKRRRCSMSNDYLVTVLTPRKN